MGDSNSYIYNDYFIVSILLLLSLLARGFGFWDWPFHGDEFYTIKHSQGAITTIKPGYYFLSKMMYANFGVHEWTARGPALFFSIASVPALYFTAKKFLNKEVAIYSVLIMLISEWHLYHSHFARFYSAVFFFGILSYFYYFSAVQSGKLKLLIYALIFNFFGIIFHTTFVVVPMSCFLFSALALLGKGIKISPSSRSIIKIHTGIAFASILVAIPVAVKILSKWQMMGQEWGYSGIGQLFQLVKYIGLVVFISGFFGLNLLLKDDIKKGLFLLISIISAILFLIVFSLFTNVRPDYIFYSLPLFFVCSAYFCHKVRQCLNENLILSHAMILVVLASMLPGFVSYYSDRLTLDIRDVTKYIEEHHRPGDRVIPVIVGFENHSNLKTENLPRNAYINNIDWSELLDTYKNDKGRVWIVVPLNRGAISSKLSNWLAYNANLVWQKQSKRIDYSLNGYQVFLKR
ncbi:MAG: glycosyltransferase family 39 protein [Gammaproteobacteria bacterium]|nr:glycosyltransferase family 39 protein [Gammaproteobacteria bacterium]